MANDQDKRGEWARPGPAVEEKPADKYVLAVCKVDLDEVATDVVEEAREPSLLEAMADAHDELVTNPMSTEWVAFSAEASRRLRKLAKWFQKTEMITVAEAERLEAEHQARAQEDAAMAKIRRKDGES